VGSNPTASATILRSKADRSANLLRPGWPSIFCGRLQGHSGDRGAPTSALQSSFSQLIRAKLLIHMRSPDQKAENLVKRGIPHLFEKLP